MVRLVFLLCLGVCLANFESILHNHVVRLMFPTVSSSSILQNYRVSEVPVGEEWRIPLLSSLLEIRDERWVINFDDEDDTETIDAIKLMIDKVCSD